MRRAFLLTCLLAGCQATPVERTTGGEGVPVVDGFCTTSRHVAVLRRVE